MNSAILVYNARLLDETMDTPGALLMADGKIRAVYSGYFTNKKTVEALAQSVLAEDGCENHLIEFHDAQGLTLTPAFIDMHTHLRYPGQEQKETLESALRAAAAGGYGTVVAMPNTSPVVSSEEMAEAVSRDAMSKNLSNVIQSVSVTGNFDGQSIGHIDFIDPSRVPLITEDGHDVQSAAVLLAAMKKAAERGIVVACHCEDASLAEAARPFREQALAAQRAAGVAAAGADDDIDDEELEKIEDLFFEANDLLSLSEDTATERDITIAKDAMCHVHIMHVSTAVALDSIRAAKEYMRAIQNELALSDSENAYESFIDGKRLVPEARDEKSFCVTCEATPHHIALRGTDEPFARAIVNPPLQMEEDRAALIEALRDGTVDAIATDHAPHTARDKENGAPGFSGLESAYAVCNTVLVNQNNFSERRLSAIMSASPARILGLNKGRLAPGCDADVVIVDPEETWTVDSANFQSKGKATPFDGMTLSGKVKELFVAARKIFPFVSDYAQS